MKLSITIAVAFLVFQNAERLCGQDNQNALDKNREKSSICSIFETPIVNAQAWESFDVLLRDRKSFESVDLSAEVIDTGAIVDVEIFSRVVFDSKLGLCYFTWVQESSVDISNDDDPDKRSMIYGICIDQNGKVSERLFPHKKTKLALTEDDINSKLKDANFPDIRGIGITASVNSSSFEMAKTFSTKFSTGQSMMATRSINPNKLEIQLNPETPNTDSEKFLTYVFDVKSSQPIKLKQHYLVMQDGKQVKSRGYEAAFTWEDMDSIYVPKTVVFSGGKARIINDKQHIGIERRDLDFHWFSLNDHDAIKEDLFSGKCLDKMSSVIDLVDPIKSGATNLIETVKQQP